MSKKITLLGSTGSIGTQSLDVIRAQGYEVFGLSAHSHVEKIHVEGEPPSPVDPSPGCYFADRCPRACEKCRQEYPQETRLPDGRVVACHLVNEGVIQ